MLKTTRASSEHLGSFFLGIELDLVASKSWEKIENLETREKNRRLPLDFVPFSRIGKTISEN